MRKYTVKPGDSWIKIANRHGLGLGDIFKWNGINYETDYPPTIHPGQEIYIRDPYKLDTAVVTADAPENYVDYGEAGRRKIDAYATAVRGGQMRYDEVPEPFRVAVGQRMVTQGTGEFAGHAANVGFNLGMFFLNPAAYASGLMAQKGLAYGLDAASGRNDYDAGDFFNHTPVMGRQFYAERPIASTLIDVGTGMIGGGLIRNAKTLANPTFWKSYLSNMKNIGGTFAQRQQLPFPQESGVISSGGSKFTSVIKGFGKSGNAVKGSPSGGYKAVITPKGTFTHSASFGNSGIPASGAMVTSTPTLVPAMPTLYPAYGPVNIPLSTPPEVTVYRPQRHIFEQQSFDRYQLPNPGTEVAPYVPGGAPVTVMGRAPIGSTIDAQALTNESLQVIDGYLPRVATYVDGAIEGTPSNIHSGLGIVYDSNNPGTLIIK